MNSWLSKTFFPTALLSVVILITIFLGIQAPLWHSSKWIMIAFFTFLSFFNYSLYEIGLKGHQTKFQNFFFLSTFIRLIASVIFIIVFLILKVENLKLLLTNFFIFYFFYLGFEIYFLLGNLRADSKQLR
jgi:hypothetical protein